MLRNPSPDTFSHHIFPVDRVTSEIQFTHRSINLSQRNNARPIIVRPTFYTLPRDKTRRGTTEKWMNQRIAPRSTFFLFFFKKNVYDTIYAYIFVNLENSRLKRVIRDEIRRGPFEATHLQRGDYYTEIHFCDRRCTFRRFY